MNDQSQKRPCREFRAGTVSAAVWEETSIVNGRNVTQYNIRIQKRYRDERSGQWKTTTYFRPDELPKLVLVANKVFEDVMLKVNEVHGQGAEQSARS